MGRGIGFKCSKCGHKYSYGTGVGFLFPMVYEELLASVKEGKYGDNWKELALKTENVAIDAEIYLYCCKSCGNWKTEEGLSLYAPKDPEEIKRKEQEEKEPWCVGFDFKEASYVTDYELKKFYVVLKKYIHKCPKCGKPMHKATRKEAFNLPCPKCGSAPQSDYLRIINWD